MQGRQSGGKVTEWQWSNKDNNNKQQQQDCWCCDTKLRFPVGLNGYNIVVNNSHVSRHRHWLSAIFLFDACNEIVVKYCSCCFSSSCCCCLNLLKGLTTWKFEKKKCFFFLERKCNHNFQLHLKILGKYRIELFVKMKYFPVVVVVVVDIFKKKWEETKLVCFSSIFFHFFTRIYTLWRSRRRKQWCFVAFFVYQWSV